MLPKKSTAKLIPFWANLNATAHQDPGIGPWAFYMLSFLGTITGPKKHPTEVALRLIQPVRLVRGVCCIPILI